MELQKYDVIIQERKRVSVITGTVGEVIGDADGRPNTGWKRDGSVPSDYKALFTDTYWNIYPPYTLEEARNGIPYNQPSSTETKSTNMFKKGDYIVALAITNGESYSTAKVGWCIKQNTDGNHLSVDKDCSVFSCSNACDVFTFDKRNDLRDWRYATPEERAEYDRLGHPFDITTLLKKKEESLVGRYLKALKDDPFDIGDIEKGDYVKIVDGRHCDDLKGDSSWVYNDSNSPGDFSIHSDFELMPIGWTPSPQGENEQTVNTYGLVLGDELKKDDLNEWCKRGKNWWSNEKESWKTSHGPFNNDRIISSFAKKDGIDGFLVSGTSNIHMRCEGFKEFCAQRKGSSKVGKQFPAYVECIKHDVGITVGRIYEVSGYKSSWCGNSNTPIYRIKVDSSGCKNTPFYCSHFKLSSKHAFDTQDEKETPSRTLLEEAERRYPKGTKFISFGDEYGQYGRFGNPDYWKMRPSSKTDEDIPTFAKNKTIKFTPRVELQKEVEYTPPSKKGVKKIVTSF